MFCLFSHFLTIFVHTQELVGLVKELKEEISSLKGTEHTRRFSRLRDELKAYCQAIDFNETVALDKLRATLNEARLSKAADMTKLSAFDKQASRHVDLHATIFSCLVSEAERETDKLFRRYEQHSTTRQSAQYRGERFQSSHGFRRDATDRRREASSDKCFACGEVSHFARDCYKRREQPHKKKTRTERKIKLIVL